MKITKKLRRRIFNAARRNNHERLQERLDSAQSSNIVNEYNETPLNFISRKIRTEADIETVKILLRNGADILRPNIDNVTPAKYLLLTKDSSLIDIVLLKLLDVQAPLDPEKNTALHIAIEAGDAQTVSKLLKLRANPNIKNSRGCSPIHVAVRNSRHDFLKDMIDHGGDIDMPGQESLTPLHMAARMNSLVSLKAVLAFKPKTEVLNNYYSTPLMELVMLNDIPPVYLIYELLEHGADPGFAKANGYNCLHLWVNRGLVNKHVDVFNFLLRLFIQFGLDINAVTVERETALHKAICNCEALIVLSLLRYGSDLKARATRGMALDMAMNRCHHGILLCVITYIAMQRNLQFKEFIVKPHPHYVIYGSIYLLTQCQIQLHSFKFNFIKRTNLSFYDIITKSTEALSSLMPNRVKRKDLDFEIDCLWTFRQLVSFKVTDGLKCRSAYKNIGLFLAVLFLEIFKNGESAKILPKLLVPYIKYHDALKFERRLMGILENDWYPPINTSLSLDTQVEQYYGRNSPLPI